LAALRPENNRREAALVLPDQNLVPVLFVLGFPSLFVILKAWKYFSVF